MSSTTPSNPSASRLQCILTNAFQDYTKQTGVDLLTKDDVASQLERCSSPDDVLMLFREKAKNFKEYRDGDRKLINLLTPVVQVVTGFLGEATSNTQASSPGKAIFAGVDVLLAAASDVSSSYDALVDLFECIGNFLRRLSIYTDMPLSDAMMDILVKIMVEVLSVLGLATKQIKQGRFKKPAKVLFKGGDIDAVLQRLDRLAEDETRMTGVQTLEIIHGLVNNVKLVMDNGDASMNGIQKVLVSIQEAAIMENKTRRDQLLEKVRNWLSPPDPSTNQNIIFEAFQVGTASWFFQGNVFAEWKATCPVLWIHGKLGSGKSTLISSIIQDLDAKRAAGLASVVYYYFDFRDADKQNPQGLLSSLLVQFAADSDPCSEILSRLYMAHARGARKPTDVALMHCLKDMLEQHQQATYIVIDAIDECPNSSGFPTPREKVLEFIGRLIDLQFPHLRICVSSRFEIDIRDALEPLAYLRVSLDEESGQRKDILDYVTKIVRTDKRMRKWREEDKLLVIKILVEKSDGMFRWAFWQLESLRRCPLAHIQSAIHSLPKCWDETYKKALLNIDAEQQEYSQRLFQCLTVSIRPLRIDELAEILAIRFNSGSIPNYNAVWRSGDANEAVLSAGSGLITATNVDGSLVVQFSHFSVKEFLTSEYLVTMGSELIRHHILPGPAHTVMANACLCILLMLDDNMDKKAIKNFPLALYAARHWVEHAQFDDVSSHIQVIMFHLFDFNKPHFRAWIWLYDPDRRWGNHMCTPHPTRPQASPLYYAALCGFRDVAKHLVDAHPQYLNARSGTCGTPLHAALDREHQSVALILLERGADIGCLDFQSRTPLHIACRGCTNVVSVLINRGVDLNAEDDIRETSLHVASQWDRGDITQLLLENGAEADHMDSGGWTPLHVASHEGHDKIVQLLFDHGADANRPDNGGWTPLHLASWEGHEHIVRLLLDHGINVSHTDNGGWTPLHLAAQEGHSHVVGLLLDHGADPNHTNSDGSTPLYVALQRNHDYTTQLLLDHGADLNYPNSDCSTLLHLASQRGHDDAVRLLLHHGAVADRLDGDGRASLHLASQRGHYDVVKLLLEHGADLNHTHSDGLTPLHLASQDGHDHVVRLLIERGAGLNHVNSKGLTPLHLASQRGHDHIVRLLLEHGADPDHRNSDFPSRKGGVGRKAPGGCAITTRTRRRV